MIDIVWLIMEKLTLLIPPMLGLYLVFDFIGSLFFSKR